MLMTFSCIWRMNGRAKEQSSANNLTGKPILSGKSSIKARKSRLPISVPCGTTDVMGTTCDDDASWTIKQFPVAKATYPLK